MKIYKADENIDLHENLIENISQTLTHLSIKKGQEIPRHKSDDSVLVIIYKGKVDFMGENESQIIEPGKVIELEIGEFHSLRAIEDSQIMVVKSKLR